MPESPELPLARAKAPAAGPSGLRVRVIAAADAILRSGRRPTIESIRQQLGGGSQTTLMAHLNDWYRELGERIAAAETPFAGMPAEASQLLQQLWRLASKAGHSNARDPDGGSDVAQRMLEAERDSLSAQNKALETLNGELKAQRRNIERLLTDTRALLNRREAELIEERAQRAESEQSLARARLDIEVHRARQTDSLSTLRPPAATKRRRSAKTAKPKRRSKARGHHRPVRAVKSIRRKTLLVRRRNRTTPLRRATKRPTSPGKTRKSTSRHK